MQEIVNSEMTPTNKQRLVKIASDYSGSSIIETFIDMTPAGAKIIHVNSAGKNKAFGLKSDTMDAATDVWMNFRNECARVDNEEETRKIDVMIEVASICENYPEIEVNDYIGSGDRQWWNLWCEKVNFTVVGISSIDELLTHVQSAKERLDARKTVVEQINTLLHSNPEIKLAKDPQYGDQFRWVRAGMVGWTMVSRSANNADDILTAIQSSIEEVNEAKAEQKRLQSIDTLKEYEVLYENDPNTDIHLTFQWLEGAIPNWTLYVPALELQDKSSSDPIEMLKLVEEAVAKLAGKDYITAQTPALTTQDFDNAHDITAIFAENAD